MVVPQALTNKCIRSLVIQYDRHTFVQQQICHILTDFLRHAEAVTLASAIASPAGIHTVESEPFHISVVPALPLRYFFRKRRRERIDSLLSKILKNIQFLSSFSSFGRNRFTLFQSPMTRYTKGIEAMVVLFTGTSLPLSNSFLSYSYKPNSSIRCF